MPYEGFDCTRTGLKECLTSYDRNLCLIRDPKPICGITLLRKLKKNRGVINAFSAFSSLPRRKLWSLGLLLLINAYRFGGTSLGAIFLT